VVELGELNGIKRDGRKLTSEEQYLVRESAVRMCCELGHSKLDAALALGVTRQSVGTWVIMYEEFGCDGLKLGRRGRRPGEQAKLKNYQCAAIVKLITDNTPDQLKLPFVLWTAAAVRDLINVRFEVFLPLRTMRKYLRRWNFTPQKPIRKAWQQSSTQVRRWLEDTYPEIARRAKARGASIYWVDETGVTNQANSQKGYAPRGETPVLRQNGTKRKVNMVSGVTNRGDVRFMCYTSSMTQSKFILFLSKLLKSNEGPVVVITDNLSVHHGKRVAKWVEDQGYRIELEFIPGYSPELNADEYLNRDLKKNVNAKRTPDTVSEVKANVISFMRSIQQQPARVLKYFTGRNINYASECICGPY
jgi:transposase